jgi:3-oxoacyl-[acyl-carrier-protein] synthase II
VARAISAALADAGLRAEQVGYYNAHGTGTAANDPAEWRAVQLAFGEHARRLPVSSTKSAIGHAQGAAGALETIATILALERELLLPTLRFSKPRRDCPTDPVGEGRPRAARYRHAVCSNSAFGGSNAALVVSVPRAAPPPRPLLARPVSILGVGAVAGHGLELDAFERAIASSARLEGRVPDFAIERLVPHTDPRGMDPSSRYLTAAAALALEDARLRISGERRDRAGLIVGVNELSAASAHVFQDSIARRGMAKLSATTFARMVLNASAGTCSSALALRGPIAALSIGDGSGLAAAAYAAQLLAARPELDHILAAGVDELADPPAGELGEGSACLVLSATEDGAAPRVAGWGMSGPGALAGAVDEALARAGLPFEALDACFGGDDPRSLCARRELAWCDPSRSLGYAGAASAALACAAAVLALRRRDLGAALVTAGRGRAAVALVLTCQGGG